jgi:predicted porin
MNKKLLAFAVAAAFTAPMVANADSGNVKISGDMHVSVDSLDNGNTRNLNASSNSSHIMFSGDEDLGNGTKAVWQLDTEVGLGATGSSSSAWTNRNSFLGLAGGFGVAIVGKHDTPVKILGRKADLFGDQIGDSRNLISDSGNSAGWDLRPSNVIAYISPTVSGVHGAIAYVTNVVDGVSSKAGGVVTALQPGSLVGPATDGAVTAWSGLVVYEGGPALVGLGYEKHNLSKLASGVNDESIWRLAGGYSFGDAKVTGLYQKESDILGSSNGRKVWGLGAAYKLGATTLKGQYYKANSVDSTSNTGASMFALGADYSLSKRTVAYAAVARTNNDTNAGFSAYAGGHGDNPGIATGQDGTGISLGLKHSF